MSGPTLNLEKGKSAMKTLFARNPAYPFRLIPIVLAMVSLILASPLEARKKKAEEEKATAAAAAVDLAMPSGWSDQMLDQLTQGQDPRRTIAVLEFEGAEKIPVELGLSLADMAITYLHNTGKFNVVERTRLDKVIREQEFQLSDMVGTQVAELGRLLGADAVVFGTVTGTSYEEVQKISYNILQTEVQVDIRCVDASSGKIIYSEQSVGRVDKKLILDSRGNIVSGNRDPKSEYAEACRKALGQASAQIAAKFPLLGYVVSVSGDQVLTDVGSTRGVQPGSQFIVFRKGEAIIHPATGQKLGWSKQIIGLIQIDSSEEKMSSGHILALKDANDRPRVGDLVILK